MTNQTQKTETTTPAAIRNASAMTDKALRAFLAAHGVEHPKGARRARLIAIAREAGLFGAHGDVVPAHHKARYGASQSCNDDIAEALAAFVRVPHPTKPGKTVIDEALMRQVAEANEVDLDRWAHLNIGMVRMNLGNVLRGKVKRGENAIVGLSEWNVDEDESAEAL